MSEELAGKANKEHVGSHTARTDDGSSARTDDGSSARGLRQPGEEQECHFTDRRNVRACAVDCQDVHASAVEGITTLRSVHFEM